MMNDFSFRLDQNQQYVLFERSARQSLAWIKEEGNNNGHHFKMPND